jgi:RNA polymerase sigma-70 factor, ECF subfamily
MLDEKIISSLYDRHARELLVYINTYVRSQETAEDILQDSFVKLIAYTNEKDLDLSNPRALLYTIARNRSLDVLRRGRKMEQVPLIEEINYGAAPPQDAVDLDELHRAIDKALMSMDELTRSVFVMKKESDMTFAEIAQALGISERTAKRKMQKALEDLTKDLENAGFSDFFILLLAFLWASDRFIN